MKKLLLFIFLASGVSAVGQVIYDVQGPSSFNGKLDGRNGFKDFRFGDLIGKYKNKLHMVENNPEEFELIAIEPSSLFGRKWERLFCLSEQQKLKSLAVFWKDDQATYDDLLHNLELLFGKAFHPKIKKLKKQGYEVNSWQGNNLKMIFYRDIKNVSEQPCTDCRIVLILYCNKFPDNFLNDF
jgi:hypothetical protein